MRLTRRAQANRPCFEFSITLYPMNASKRSPIVPRVENRRGYVCQQQGPLALFGRAARSQYDKKTVDIQLPIPPDWWFNGVNTVKRTSGFSIEDTYVEFSD